MTISATPPISGHNPEATAGGKRRGTRRKRVTLDAFLNSGKEEFSEWVDGEVIQMSVTDQHQELVQFFSALMQVLAEQKDLGTVRTAPYAMKISSRPSGREPDILFVRRENQSLITEQYLNGPADVVVEIVSEESVTRDRRDKFFEYALAGVSEYWLADYRKQRAEFYRLNEYGTYDRIEFEEDGVFRSEALSGFWIKVEWLWQDPHPKLLTVLKEWGLV